MEASEIKYLLQKLTSGKLTEEEWTDLQQQAENDAFLAEALDGYLEKGLAQSATLKNLRQQLSSGGKKNRPFLWHIAAASILLTGTIIWMLREDVQRRDQEFSSDLVLESLPGSPQETGMSPLDRKNSDSMIAFSETIIPSAPPQVIQNQQNNAKTPEAKTKPESAMMAEKPIEIQNTAAYAHVSEPETTSTLNGKISDDLGFPLAGADIQVLPGSAHFSSDRDGQFRLPVRDNLEEVTFRYSGYQELRLKNPGSQELSNVTLNELQDQKTQSQKMDRVDKSARAMAAQPPITTTETITPQIGWRRYHHYLNQNRKKPEQSENANITGKVILQFEINNDGEPENISIIQSLGYGCDEEAIRLLQWGPLWQGTGKGRLEVEF